ncbi:MAG: hypothetical protein L6V81_02510 [Clostridium sp.]|nr:MAG: hypothetical protein L6V81_02510 [Clostridium sp.]
MTEVNRRFNQAISTMLIITIPMALMLLILSNESYTLFYGASEYGSTVLKVSAISHIFFGVWSVINTCLQSMRKFKNSIYKFNCWFSIKCTFRYTTYINI